MDEAGKPQIEEEKWEHAFHGVVKTLGAFGAVNVLEKCDFWVVEDFYGTPEVLVELVGEKFVTDPMRNALKWFLKEKAPEFGVVLRNTKMTDAADEIIVA